MDAYKSCSFPIGSDYIFCIYIFLFSDTLKGNGVFYSINNAFFQTVSARTAGFYSVPVNLFSEFIDVILLFLMSVGASPGGTVRGIKVTSLALVFIFVRSLLKGDEDFVLFKRRVPVDIVKKALAVFIIFFVSITFFSAILVLLESCLKPLDVVFEVVSVFATVGLSLGITADLSVEGKVLIIIAVIVGRIGILTLFILVLDSVGKRKSVRYPEARVLVGKVN
ncbi:potassium transporter TrkG [Candidatus Endomicrobiellum trichonymphae]|uniref:potassium transporter TrkG n=1 Tax=Endomicrobium trichonymphae TaxID=1408204 RepID=UPI000BAA63D7|nr:potassium transporter TrkG [Candidatus Endomicrobium trichonymphae]